MASRETSRVANESDLARAVRKSLDIYFRDLDGERPAPLYDMVIANVEMPLIQDILERVEGNQTQAAELLGMNRNTLRKKMKLYGLL